MPNFIFSMFSSRVPGSPLFCDGMACLVLVTWMFVGLPFPSGRWQGDGQGEPGLPVSSLDLQGAVLSTRILRSDGLSISDMQSWRRLLWLHETDLFKYFLCIEIHWAGDTSIRDFFGGVVLLYLFFIFFISSFSCLHSSFLQFLLLSNLFKHIYSE